MTPNWVLADAPQPIAPAEVHVWGWSLHVPASDLENAGGDSWALLSEAERTRCLRFHFDADRARFAMAHGNLRRILGAYQERPPAALRFAANPSGKPELPDEGDSPQLHFNLTHTREVALLAVSRDLELGIDCEEVREIEPEVAASYFSPLELARLNTLEGGEWLSGFYRCWTRKEAVLKAEGVGLGLALDAFDVSLLQGEPAELLGTRVALRHAWSLADIEPGADRIAALATSRPAAKIACFWLR